MTATLTQTVQRHAAAKQVNKKHNNNKQSSVRSQSPPHYPIKSQQQNDTTTSSKQYPQQQPIKSFALAKRGYAVPAERLSPTAQKYTWQQVAEHNTSTSCWMYIGHTVYDVTPWLNRHPGGRDILLLSAGRDVTDLFESYHPFTQLPHKLLSKYAIGEVTHTEFPQYKPDSGFYSDVRREAKEYFTRNKLNYKAPTPGLIRLAGMLLVAALCFYVIVFCARTTSFAVRAACAVVFGVCQALPLLHVMHDASHTAIGNSPRGWSLAGRLCMDWFAGASLYSWHNQHVIGHHVYTNVMGVDPDLPQTARGDIRRVSELQHHTWAYKFQHIYLLVLYGVLALKFRIQDITSTLVDASNGAIRVNHLSGETQRQVASKCFWLTWRVLVPLLWIKVPFWPFVALFLISEFTTGYYLTFNFQVSHVSPDVLFPHTQTERFDEEWAASQLASTVDYAHESKLATFLCGALNHQSTHHLLPTVSQYHYPALAPIVQRLAKKHNVQYNYVGSFFQAFKLHVKHLMTMGAGEIHHH